jgi:hypothetical protein
MEAQHATGHPPAIELSHTHARYSVFGNDASGAAKLRVYSGQEDSHMLSWPNSKKRKSSLAYDTKASAAVPFLANLPPSVLKMGSSTRLKLHLSANRAPSSCRIKPRLAPGQGAADQRTARSKDCFTVTGNCRGKTTAVPTSSLPFQQGQQCSSDNADNNDQS